jgi:molybdopterin-biosynthesis enzyme MoeA-like protein
MTKDNTFPPVFGAYIIGDEILSGKRKDAHLTKVIELLTQRGLNLSWASYLPDDPHRLVERFKQSFSAGEVIFCFGGIGATPDDFTRQAVAQALGVPIERHVEAVKLIEMRYGESAYPNRVLMADFPQGAKLIPNPVNQVAGFSIHEHYCMPGFPEMSHPMLEWVLETYYSHLFQKHVISEASILVMDAGESALLQLMQTFVEKYPQLKLFSLPKLDDRRTTELGMKGNYEEVMIAITEIKQAIEALNFPWKDA